MKVYQKYITNHPNKTILAQQLNVSYSFIGALRRGERRPSLSVLERIAQLSKRSVPSLLREVHNEQATANITGTQAQ